MIEETCLDEKLSDSTESNRKNKFRIIVLSIVAFMIFINIGLICIGPLPTRDYYNTAGEKLRTSSEEFIYPLIGIVLIGIPLVSSIISAILSIIPYQKKSYYIKFSSLFLFVMFIINVAFMILLAVKIFEY